MSLQSDVVLKKVRALFKLRNISNSFHRSLVDFLSQSRDGKNCPKNISFTIWAVYPCAPLKGQQISKQNCHVETSPKKRTYDFFFYPEKQLHTRYSRLVLLRGLATAVCQNINIPYLYNFSGQCCSFVFWEKLIFHILSVSYFEIY